MNDSNKYIIIYYENRQNTSLTPETPSTRAVEGGAKVATTYCSEVAGEPYAGGER